MTEDNPRHGWIQDIPSNWTWAGFSDVLIDATDSKRKLAKTKYQRAGTYPVIDQGEEFAAGFTDDPALVSSANIPCIVWGDHTRRAKYLERRFVQGADGVKVLEATPAVLPAFIYKQVAFAELPDRGYSRHFRFLRSKEFPIPPFSEQKRIVHKLETLSARTAVARGHLKSIEKLIERASGAVLSKALKGTLVPSQLNSGEPTKLGQLIVGIEQGWSPKCENESETNPERWAVLTTTAIQAVTYDSGENKRLPEHLAPRPHLEVKVGDVLMTRAGPRVRCAVCCYVAETAPRRIFSDKVYRIRFDASVEPEFFVMVMNAPEMVRALDVIKSGGSESGLNLTQERLKSLSINLWDRQTQRAVVAEVKRKFTRIDRLASEAAKALSMLGRLDQRILANAFAGKLVPQDPSDEPAESPETYSRGAARAIERAT